MPKKKDKEKTEDGDFKKVPTEEWNNIVDRLSQLEEETQEDEIYDPDEVHEEKFARLKRVKLDKKGKDKRLVVGYTRTWEEFNERTREKDLKIELMIYDGVNDDGELQTEKIDYDYLQFIRSDDYETIKILDSQIKEDEDVKGHISIKRYKDWKRVDTGTKIPMKEKYHKIYHMVEMPDGNEVVLKDKFLNMA